MSSQFCHLNNGMRWPMAMPSARQTPPINTTEKDPAATQPIVACLLRWRSADRAPCGATATVARDAAPTVEVGLPTAERSARMATRAREMRSPDH
eukprot:scaffold100997_cov24-Tisochrysis_lutea.AAC.3